MDNIARFDAEKDDLEEYIELLECCFDSYETPQEEWVDYLLVSSKGKGQRQTIPLKPFIGD